MLNNIEFDKWAAEYDADVVASDRNNEYPFAGYQKLMRTLYEIISKTQAAKVLDIGIGTGTLSTKLYENGCDIYGIDFSEEMLQITKNKIPDGEFIQWDLAKGLPPQLEGMKFDFIISTYALHHFETAMKISLINQMPIYLKEGGKILIGDIGFETAAALEECRETFTDIWDEDEFSIVVEEIEEKLDCKMNYQQLSHCCVLLELT